MEKISYKNLMKIILKKKKPLALSPIIVGSKHKLILFGSLIGIVLMLIYLWFNSFFFITSWSMGWVDPSSAFAESLISLYDFVWFWLIVVMIFVLTLLLRIVYLFSWNGVFFKMPLFSKIINYFLNVINIYGFSFDEKDAIKNSVIKIYWSNLQKLYLSVWYNRPINDFNYYLSGYYLESIKILDSSEYKKLELLWCVFPSVVLLSLIGPTFSLVFSLDPAIDPMFTVKVIGHQWYWSYQLDGIDVNNSDFNINIDSVMIQENDLFFGEHRLLEVDNRLILPIGVPIRFLVTSMDVLHSWAVPALGFKVDAVPGRLNQFIVEIKKPGVYYGQCSELCGVMHGFMPIVIHAVLIDEFNNWLLNN